MNDSLNRSHVEGFVGFSLQFTFISLRKDLEYKVPKMSFHNLSQDLLTGPASFFANESLLKKPCANSYHDNAKFRQIKVDYRINSSL